MARLASSGDENVSSEETKEREPLATLFIRTATDGLQGEHPHNHLVSFPTAPGIDPTSHLLGLQEGALLGVCDS